jgi:hypothetical protein
VYGADMSAVASFDDDEERTPEQWASDADHPELAAWLSAVSGWSQLRVAAGCRLHGAVATQLKQGRMDPDSLPWSEINMAREAASTRTSGLKRQTTPLDGGWSVQLGSETDLDIVLEGGMCVLYGEAYRLDMSDPTHPSFTLMDGETIRIAHPFDPSSAVDVGATIVWTHDNAEHPTITWVRKTLAPPAEDAPEMCPITVKLIKGATRCWAPPTHWLHHAGVRVAVHTMLQVSERLHRLHSALPVAEAITGEQLRMLPILPPEMWIAIMGFFLRRNWAVVGGDHASGNT